MHCLIIAGGQVRPEDALYPYTQGLSLIHISEPTRPY